MSVDSPERSFPARRSTSALRHWFPTLLACLLGTILVAGCGGDSDGDQVTSLLRDYYENPALRSAPH